MADNRILKGGKHIVTGVFKQGSHMGIDFVSTTNGVNRVLDYIVAHSDGVIKEIRKGYSTTDKTGNSYGNYVLIEHTNGMATCYAHLKNGSNDGLNIGDKVKQGQIIGYMGSTGRSTGGHLHFEVRKTTKHSDRIDPTPFLNKDIVEKKYEGFLDTFTTNSLSGWLYNGISGTVEDVIIKIYNGNKLVKTLTTKADKYRTDLMKARKGNGKVAFAIDFNLSTLGVGEYIATAYSKSGFKLTNSKSCVIKPKVVAPKPTINTPSTYKVKSGDSLGVIATIHKTTVAELVKLNNISNPNIIRVGQVLKLPTPISATPPKVTQTQNPLYQTYVVKKGDTLWGIASKLYKNGARYVEIKKLNNLTSNNLKIGQILKVKGE